MAQTTANTPGNTERATHEPNTAPGADKNKQQPNSDQRKSDDAPDATRPNTGGDRSGKPGGQKDDRNPATPAPDHGTEKEEGNDPSRTQATDKRPDAQRGNTQDGAKTTPGHTK